MTPSPSPSPSASLSPKLEGSLLKAVHKRVIKREPEAPLLPEMSPLELTTSVQNSGLNLFATPFTPSSQGPTSQTIDSTSTEGSPETIGTIVPEQEWTLERVQKFECRGELEDYEELEELAAAHLDRVESDYTSDTGESTDTEEDFEVQRAKEMEELRSFSNTLNGSHTIACC